tara:strand:+ start:4433 stop:4651 length:219 start_codon:yes stop_codon:yes gene_type:complete
MPKYYVTDARREFVVHKPTAIQAGRAAVCTWFGKGVKLEKDAAIAINETGFEKNTFNTEQSYSVQELIGLVL